MARIQVLTLPADRYMLVVDQCTDDEYAYWGEVTDACPAGCEYIIACTDTLEVPAAASTTVPAPTKSTRPRPVKSTDDFAGYTLGTFVDGRDAGIELRCGTCGYTWRYPYGAALTHPARDAQGHICNMPDTPH